MDRYCKKVSTLKNDIKVQYLYDSFGIKSINIKTFFCSCSTLSNDPDDTALRQKIVQKVVVKPKGQRKTHNDATEVATAHDPSESAGRFKNTFWCLMCQQSFVCKTSWKKHQKVK